MTGLRKFKQILASGIAITAMFSMVACSFHARPIFVELASPTGELRVERIDEGEVRIRWPASYTLASVRVYAGTSPETIDHSKMVARTWGLTQSVVVKNLDPFVRYYFEVVPDSSAESRVVAERRLPLQGTDNFRDLGGYVTQDGSFVKWGLLYRSNDLADLTSRDLQYLGRLGVRLVCDFRSEGERVANPNRTPDVSAPPATANLEIAVEGVDPAKMQWMIRTGRLSGPQMEQTMEAAYRAFVTDFGDRYRAMFERISNPDQLPTILHCTAGKDRTGFASAMVLMTLGVPEETVFDDYMRTNLYRANYNKWIKRLVPVYSLFRTGGDDMAPLLDARRSYLQASLDAIHDNYGDFDGYLEQGLGIDTAQRERLKRMFLQ